MEKRGTIPKTAESSRPVEITGKRQNWGAFCYGWRFAARLKSCPDDSCLPALSRFFEEGDEMEATAYDQREWKGVERHVGGPLGDGEAALREAGLPFLAA